MRRAKAASSCAISVPNSSARMIAGRTNSFSLPLCNSLDSIAWRVADSRIETAERAVPRAAAMPCHASTDTSTPCSFAVGTSGWAGTRLLDGCPARLCAHGDVRRRDQDARLGIERLIGARRLSGVVGGRARVGMSLPRIAGGLMARHVSVAERAARALAFEDWISLAE